MAAQTQNQSTNRDTYIMFRFIIIAFIITYFVTSIIYNLI